MSSRILEATRPWHGAWPAHLPPSLEYPAVPAWWLLERNLPRFAERAAVRELDHDTLAEGRTLTYEALWTAVRGAASGLRSRGVEPGVRVGFCLPNSAALIVGYYATWYAGGVVVPANPLATEGELAQQLSDAGVSLVVGAAGGVGQAVAGTLTLPFVDTAAFRAMEHELPAAPAACRPEDDVAVLLYTGGTTGAPKGAMLTHRNIVANTLQFATWYAFQPGDEVSACAIPMFHSGGMSGVMNVPLSAGATLLVFPRFAAAPIARAVERYRVTRLFGVPTMFIALLNDPTARSADYASLRACRTNAAPLPPTVKTAFDTLVGREVLIEGYGLTETSPLTHANPISRAKAGSIGIPLPDTDARIVDLTSGLDVAPGESGELVIRGPPGDARVLEPAGGHRRGDRGRLAPHRRRRDGGRRGVLRHRRSPEGHDQHRGVQGLAARGRGGALRPSGRAAGGGGRRARRLPRRSGEGLRGAQGRHAVQRARAG